MNRAMKRKFQAGLIPPLRGGGICLGRVPSVPLRFTLPPHGRKPVCGGPGWAELVLSLRESGRPWVRAMTYLAP